MSPFRLGLALFCSFAVTVGCGGKIAGETAEQGAGGDGSGEPPSDSRLPPRETSEPTSDPSEPGEPPPDDIDDPAVRDPFEIVYDRCRELCELTEVRCQDSLGSSVAMCTEECAKSAGNVDLPVCRDRFVAVLECVQDVAIETECRDEFQGQLVDRCSDLLTEHGRECLEGSILPPPPDPDLVVCDIGVGTASDTSCSSRLEGCSDGRVYEVSCRQLSASSVECDCSIDGQADLGFAFDDSGADAFERFCQSPEGFAVCGFPVSW